MEKLFHIIMKVQIWLPNFSFRKSCLEKTAQMIQPNLITCNTFEFFYESLYTDYENDLPKNFKVASMYNSG